MTLIMENAIHMDGMSEHFFTKLFHSDIMIIIIIVNDKRFCRLLLADMHGANVVSGCARQ